MTATHDAALYPDDEHRWDTLLSTCYYPAPDRVMYQVTRDDPNLSVQYFGGICSVVME